MTSKLQEILISNSYPAAPEKDRLKVIVFNAERGKHVDLIEAYFRYHAMLKDADIILANELDIGMARSGNCNTVKELSQRLNMNYIFGAEFLELTKGEATERISPGENTEALHGNAIMSRFRLYDPYLVRLPLEYDWFHDYQQRLGSRIALLAKIKMRTQEWGLVCTHLENKTSPEGRARQMNVILEHVAERFGQLPVILGGDMNTSTIDGSRELVISEKMRNFIAETKRLCHPEAYEPLFTLLEQRGFDYRNANLAGKKTCRAHLEEKFQVELNLDWIFTKGLESYSPAVISTIVKKTEILGFSKIEEGEEFEISDHNAIAVEVKQAL